MNSIQNQITSRKKKFAVEFYNKAECDELVACRVFVGCLSVVYMFLQKHMLATHVSGGDQLLLLSLNSRNF